MPTRESPPIYEPVAAPDDRNHALGLRLPRLMATLEWIKWWSNLTEAVDQAPSRQAGFTLSGQAASLSTTPIPLAELTGGLWRVSYYLQILTPGGASGSVQITFSWTRNGVAQTETAALLNGNTTTTHQFGTLPLRIDAGTPISYAVAYASAGVPAMTYELALAAELVAPE